MFQSFQVAYLREHVKIKEVRRLSYLRQSVAYVLSQSARKIPHAAAMVQYDVTPLVEYAQASARTIEEEDAPRSDATRLQRAIRRRFSSFFLKAIAHGLSHMPEMNAFIDYSPWRTRGTLYVAEDINISFTVHTKAGVVRPVIRNAHKKDLATIANEMRDLARRARRTDPDELYRRISSAYTRASIRNLDLGSLDGLWVYFRSFFLGSRSKDQFRNIPESEKLQAEDVLGSTCTIANIGTVMPGHQTVTVIIPPEVMMFGIGEMSQVPMVVDDKIVPRWAITIVATMDHRAMDGGEAFPFHQQLARYINNPSLIYEWKDGDDL